VQRPAAEFFRAAEDHRVPDGRSGPLADVDGREDVSGGGTVHMPVNEAVDNPRGGRRLERLGDLPRRGDEELLQHLTAQAALPGLPKFLDQGARGCACPQRPRRGRRRGRSCRRTGGHRSCRSSGDMTGAGYGARSDGQVSWVNSMSTRTP
jgi:hypothetical protein